MCGKKGIYVINWDTEYHPVISPVSVYPANDWRPPLSPNLTVHLLAHFRPFGEMLNMGCLQMTRTAVWLDWPAESLRNAMYERKDATSSLAREGFLLPNICLNRESFTNATLLDVVVAGSVCYIDFSPVLS